jgi:hypothetical protein
VGAIDRYAVVSCHVERPLDDRVWQAFERVLEQRPGGFVVTPFLRPPDAASGEDERVWLERARRASALAPLGHHTHWGGPDHAGPPAGVDAAGVVRAEIEWLRERGVAPRWFCGGRWYLDTALAETLAANGYSDCSATTFRQSYLGDGAPRLQLPGPRRLLLASGASLLELPATHSLGMLGRGLLRLDGHVHVHFHDWELVDRVRAAALHALLRILRLRRTPVAIDTFAELAANVPEIAWSGATIGT